MKPDRGAVLHTRDLLRKLKELQGENADLRNKVGKLSKKILEDRPDLVMSQVYGYYTSAAFYHGKPVRFAWSVDESGQVFTFDMPKGIK